MTRHVYLSILAILVVATSTACSSGTPLLPPEGDFRADAGDLAASTEQAVTGCPSPTCTDPTHCQCGMTGPIVVNKCVNTPTQPAYVITVTAAPFQNILWNLGTNYGITDQEGLCTAGYAPVFQSGIQSDTDFSDWVDAYTDANHNWVVSVNAGAHSVRGTIEFLPLLGGGSYRYVLTEAFAPAGAGATNNPVQVNGSNLTGPNVYSAPVSVRGPLSSPGSRVGVQQASGVNYAFAFSPPGSQSAWTKIITLYIPGLALATTGIVTATTTTQALATSPRVCGFWQIGTSHPSIFYSGSTAELTGLTVSNFAQAYCLK